MQQYALIYIYICVFLLIYHNIFKYEVYDIYSIYDTLIFQFLSKMHLLKYDFIIKLNKIYKIFLLQYYLLLYIRFYNPLNI